MPSHYRGSDSELRALNAYIALMRCAASVTTRIHRHLTTVALTIGQFGALEALLHLGPMAQHELARKLLCSEGNMTTVLNNLQRRGLVQRSRDQKDRRRSLVRLTSQGEELMREVFPRHVTEVVRQVGWLAGEEQDQLRAVCRKLGVGPQGQGTATP